jgi:hypothetical protein
MSDPLNESASLIEGTPPAQEHGPCAACEGEQFDGFICEKCGRNHHVAADGTWWSSWPANEPSPAPLVEGTQTLIAEAEGRAAVQEFQAVSIRQFGLGGVDPGELAIECEYAALVIRKLLAALAAVAPQQQKEKDFTRVDTKADSSDSPTARDERS